MQILLTFILFCVAVHATNGAVCESKMDVKLKMFNNEGYYMSFPCKFWALKRQACGPWMINLTPGNHWLGKRYYLDTMWLAVWKKDDETQRWEGRTTNKIVIKFHNDKSGTRDLFNTRPDSTLSLKEVFDDTGKDKRRAFVKNEYFKVSFEPWHPRTKGYNHAAFKFECYANDALNSYPQQMCGDGTKKVIYNRAKLTEGSTPFGLEDRFAFLVTYYDLFMNEDVSQMDGKCLAATSLLKDTCTSFDQRLQALRNCHQILSSKKHTQCVTKFSCDPMDIFNACLEWACTGNGFQKDAKAPCSAVGEAIDLCPTFASSGNLSERVTAANCYKDFLPIDTDEGIMLT